VFSSILPEFPKIVEICQFLPHQSDRDFAVSLDGILQLGLNTAWLLRPTTHQQVELTGFHQNARAQAFPVRHPSLLGTHPLLAGLTAEQLDDVDRRSFLSQLQRGEVLHRGRHADT